MTALGDNEVTIALPPVLPAGTALELAVDGRAARPTAAPRSCSRPTAACLRLSLGSIRRVDRRGEPRVAPNLPLAVHATVDAEAIHAAVRDVSPSGIAFWAEGHELPVGTELRLTLTLANGDVLAADVPAEVVRVVRDAHGPGHDRLRLRGAVRDGVRARARLTPRRDREGRLRCSGGETRPDGCSPSDSASPTSGPARNR